MITDQDQAAWIQVRENTCSGGPDPLGCRIRLTRERTHVILRQHPLPRPGAWVVCGPERSNCRAIIGLRPVRELVFT